MPAPDLRIGSIVMDVDDFPRMMEFWQAALRYEPREPATDGWVVLRDPQGHGPNVSINRTSEGHLEPYRLHLDLYTSDPEAEVARLVALGAKIRLLPPAGHDFVELADPDGNAFCVVQK